MANDDLLQRWWKLEAKLTERFGKKPDLETILFLIGIQEFGQIKEKFTKEQKQDLMHIAICRLLSQSGYYELKETDEEGWPHFIQLKPMPEMSTIEQENFLKDHILLYFENQPPAPKGEYYSFLYEKINSLYYLSFFDTYQYCTK